MSTETKTSINWVAVITMMFLCGMIAFVTYKRPSKTRIC